MTHSPPLLAAHDLSYTTPDGRPLVRGLTFAVNRGEILAVSGPNGVGKSTLLKMILGEARPSSGEFKLGGRSLSFLSQLHNREFHLPLRLADVLAFNQSGRFFPTRAVQFGLLSEREMELSWNTASGGERQKTLLTQALLAEADLLILDEPMNHLDTATRRKLVEMLLQLVKHGRQGVLMVCHEKTLSELNIGSVKTIELSRYADGC